MNFVYSLDELNSTRAMVASSDANRTNYMARAMLYPKGKFNKTPVGVIDTFNRTTKVMNGSATLYITTTETTITRFNDMNPLVCHFTYASADEVLNKKISTVATNDKSSVVSITPKGTRRMLNIQPNQSIY
jgi:hypothetical protein